MTKRAVISSLVVSFIAVTVVGLTLRDPGIWVSNQRRPEPRMPTITTLPEFPRIPTSGVGLSRQEMPSEDLRPFLETVQNLPPGVRVRINSKPAHLAGNVDRTLFAYYTYLLIADKNREVYWTCKEGTSDVPHYWYREFDLDLGGSLGNIRFDESIWSREFENALVLVNPGKKAGTCSWDGAARYHDVKGVAVSSPVTLPSRTAMLLIKNLAILPK